MSIGTVEHARQAQTLHDSTTDWDREKANSDEWRFLGEGCYRAAFLHIATGVVYKVGSGWANALDHKTSTELRKFIWQHVYVPKTSLFDLDNDENTVIVAMEYVDAPLAVSSGGDATHPGHREWRRKGGCSDMHRANWVKFSHANSGCEGTFIPIDMGADW